MENRDEGWRPLAKNQLKPLPDRVVRRLGDTLPTRGLTYDQLVHLIYPSLLLPLRDDLATAADGDVSQVTTIRRIL